jgi:hypothetical protein
MKKTILFILLSGWCLVWAHSTQAQTPDEAGKPEKIKKRDEFMCQYAEFDPDTKKITMRENVRINLELLYAESDSVVFDEEKKMLWAYGIRKLTFKGGEAVASPNAKNTIRYTLGDKTIYFE